MRTGPIVAVDQNDLVRFGLGADVAPMALCEGRRNAKDEGLGVSTASAQAFLLAIIWSLHAASRSLARQREEMHAFLGNIGLASGKVIDGDARTRVSVPCVRVRMTSFSAGMGMRETVAGSVVVLTCTAGDHRRRSEAQESCPAC